MAKNIFVNLPIKNVAKTKEFFSKLGFSFNEQFSDETGLCLVVADNIYAMLMQEEKFKGFTKKDITDTAKSSEVIMALGVENKEEVDELMAKVLAAGGKDLRKEDYGWMYERSFEDPDGHYWEVFWMDSNAKPN